MTNFFRTRLKWLLPALLVLALYVIFRPVSVGGSKPQRGLAVQAVYATGEVEPEYWSKVSASVDGTIAEILVKEGDHVTAGQKLAHLKDTEKQAQIDSLEATLTLRKEEFERNRALHKNRVVSQQELDRSRQAFDEATSQLDAAKAKQDDMVLRAPMDGTVLRKEGELGEFAKNGQILFWVGKERPLWITADVDEENAPLLAVGQRALIKCDAYPDKALEGKITQITPQGDPVLKIFRARVGLPDDTPLMIGMTTEVNIIVAEKQDALLVPLEALQDNSVLLASTGRLRKVAVTPGIRSGNFVEVLSGVSDSDIIVTDARGAKPGDRVTLR